MPRNIFLVFIILLLVSCGEGVPQKKTASLYKEGEIIVKFKSGVHEGQRSNAHDLLGAKPIKKMRDKGIERVKLPDGMSVQAALESYRSHPDVEYAEPNYIVKAAAIPNANDPRFGEQWSLHNTGQVVNGFTGSAGADIDAARAWDIIQTSSVIVAVIDSGIDKAHPDISGNLTAGYDFLEDDTDPNDLNGHGTHVAGIIGAIGNNLIGITGVSWSVKIIPLKVLDQNGEGTIFDITEAIHYAAQNNAKIINMSFSGPPDPDNPNSHKTLYDEIASHPGILFVAAAGNSGSLLPEYPAGFDLSNIISVAATDQNDNIADFSNYGQTSVDVAAPGFNILSTIPSFITGITYSGTYKVTYLSYGFECIGDSSSRNSVMQKVLNFENISHSDKILIVDDDGGDFYETFYTQALQTLGYTNYDIHTVPLNSDGPSLNKLNQYKLVIWFTGGEYRNTLTFTDQVNLQSYLDNGGRLFISGQDIGYEIGSTIFYQNYLHAFYITDDALVTIYTGLNNFNGLTVELPLICSDTANNQYISAIDAVSPLGSGSLSAFFIHYNDAYQFLDGTSMATPMVSGVAALIATFYSNFNADQIKGTILGSADIKPSLQGKILTGGRLNAYKALTSLIPPSNLIATTQSGKTVLLTWTDNSSGENGFKIERKESGGQFTEIASVLTDERTYTNTTVKAGKTYAYRIRAFNSVASSAYTNEASVTIPGGNNGGGGGGCSIGMVYNVQTAIADTLILLMPVVVIWVLKRFRKH